jgi:hypothetical protein
MHPVLWPMVRLQPEAAHALDRRRSRRKRNGTRPIWRLRKPPKHHQVSVKPNTLNATHAKEREAVVMLQASEFTLDGGAAAVERPPLVATAWDVNVALAPVLAERDDRGTVALGALGVDAVVVKPS